MDANNKTIRFIDSDYRELFRIPDGGSIKIIFPPGDSREPVTRACKYLDETHFETLGRGGDVYVLGMLGDRPEIKDFELDKNELTVYRDTDSLEQTSERLTARGSGEKPSVMEQIKTARQSPGEPQEAGAQKHKKSKGEPEL